MTLRLLPVLLGLTCSVRSARADDTPSCVQAYIDAQTHRIDHQLLAARHDLYACVRPACERLMRGQLSADCRAWLGEVKKNVPSLVVVVRTSSRAPVEDGWVAVDGVVVPSFDGSIAIEIDPGQHLITYESPARGRIQQPAIVVEGVKGQRAEIIVDEDGARAASAFAPRRGGEAHTLSYLALGVGAAGLSTGIVFGALALDAQFKLDQECLRGACPPAAKSDIDAMHTRAAVADIGFAVGLLGTALAVVLWSAQGATRGGSLPVNASVIAPSATGSPAALTASIW